MRVRNNCHMRIEERFFNNVHETETCWIWEGARDKKGYGFFGTRGKVIRAHRFSWEYHNRKEIPSSDIFVCHTCDNPSCVNPQHLFLGTSQDNMSDKTSKQRQIKGSKQWFSKVTEEEVIKIRELHKNGGHSYASLAKLYNMTIRNVASILLRESWKHV